MTGIGDPRCYQETILSVLNPLNMAGRISRSLHSPRREILSGLTGTVRPGEMLLVLGKPGAGCTTFLKALANHLEGYEPVEGYISYDDNRSPSYMSLNHRGDLGYIPEEDIHFPSLTVRETLVGLLSIVSLATSDNNFSMLDCSNICSDSRNCDSRAISTGDYRQLC